MRAFHDWLGRDPDIGDREDTTLLAQFRETFEAGDRTYCTDASTMFTLQCSSTLFLHQLIQTNLINLSGSIHYGSLRIDAELSATGWRISHKRVERLMRDNGITVPKRRKRKPMTTDSRHVLSITPNLLDRGVDRNVPDTVWLAEITYLATEEGWLYLAAIKDLATP